MFYHCMLYTVFYYLNLCKLYGNYGPRAWYKISCILLYLIILLYQTVQELTQANSLLLNVMTVITDSQPDANFDKLI